MSFYPFIGSFVFLFFHLSVCQFYVIVSLLTFINYTRGIYAKGYIAFALTFVRSYVRSFVTFRHVRRIYHKAFG